MAAAVETAEQITNEVDLFAPIMQQSYLLNEFNREYAPLASLQSGAPIEFIVKGADQLYMDLNSSRFLVRVKITKADGTDLDADTAGPVNLILHSLFREMNAELNGKPVSEPNNMYPYRAYIETLLNYSLETQKTRLIAEGWERDTAGKMTITDVTGENTGLKNRATRFATSKVVELVGRPHLDIFQQDKLIPPGIDLHLKLVPSSNQFVIKCAAPGQGQQQAQYKIVIDRAIFTIRTKQLTNEAELAHRELLHERPMKMPYTRIQVKHLSIPQNQTSYSFENVFTDNLPDLVVVGLVADGDFAGDYNKNPYNFQTFGVNRVELKRNGMPVPRYGYTPDFTANRELYIKDYVTFQEQLGFDKGDKCVALTPSEWASGYTLYAFKITDGPIGSGTEGPRSRPTHGSIRLEVGFAAAQNTAIKVIILSQTLGVLKIDEFKNVVVE